MSRPTEETAPEEITASVHQLEALNSALSEYTRHFNTVPTLLRIVDEKLYQGADDKPKDCGAGLLVSELCKNGRSQYYLIFTRENESGVAVPIKLEVSITGDIGQFNYAIGEKHFEVMTGQRVSFASGMQAHTRQFNPKKYPPTISDYVRETRDCDKSTYSDKPNLQEEATSIITAFNTAYLALTSNAVVVESIEKTY